MSGDKKAASENKTGIQRELGQAFQLGGQILRQANAQIEEHLSQRVENFKTGRLDSWQQLYDQLIDEYGEHALQWKDAALRTMEEQVARLGQSSPGHWLIFDSYPDVESHLDSLGIKISEAGIRQWVVEGKPWIHVREGRIFLDPDRDHYPENNQ